MEWELFERNYWKYYLRLEKELMNILEYIEFDPANFAVYSVNLMQLLLSIGAEIDAVFKEICKITEKDRPSISDYAPIILAKYQKIIFQEVCVFKGEVKLTPFSGWDATQAGKTLFFWNAYNNVKHHRADMYKDASLEAVVNALAALFVLEMYRLNDIYLECGNLPHNIPEDASKIFYLADWTERIRTSVFKYHYRVYDDDEKREVKI